MMNIKEKLTEIARKQGLSVGFDGTKRVALTDAQKATVREDIQNSQDATYCGASMPMAESETPSGSARVTIDVLSDLIEKSELVLSKLDNAISDVANGTAKMPCIRCDATDDAVVIEQGRHRITAMHDLGYEHVMVNYPAVQREKLQAILGDDFASL